MHDDAAARQADLLQLEEIAAGYPSRARFLTELTLDPPDVTSDQPGVPVPDEDYLILSTIHSAKGQEWKSVFVLNVVDGCIPSDLATGTTADIEEERRLLHVAMTRAKDSLHLVVPQRFFIPGGPAAVVRMHDVASRRGRNVRPGGPKTGAPRCRCAAAPHVGVRARRCVPSVFTDEGVSRRSPGAAGAA